ncbi:MAG: hypothetical protein QXD57_07470 [Ignisphaera sp.]
MSTPVSALVARIRNIMRGVGGGTLLRGDIKIGEGKVLDNIAKTLDNVVNRVKEVRPNIIPAVVERVKTYQPGSRIQQLLPSTPPATASSPQPATTTQTSYSKKLLRG